MQSELTERAKTAWNSIADEFNQWDALGLDEQETYVALTAALADKQAGEVKIKPLEWDSFGRAHSEVGTYEVVCIAQGGVFGLWRPIDDGSTFSNDEGSEEHCREAAQADYEQRIRSALVDVPAVEPVAWRWKFDADADWHYGGKEPKDFRFGDPEIVETLYSSPPLSREGEDSAEVNIPADLVKRCKEILRWHASAVLENGELRALARRIRSKLNNVIDGGESLRHAEEETKREAMRLIITLAATRSGSATTQKGCADE